MIQKLTAFGQRHPIFLILSAAFLLRLAVAFISDDHGLENERFLYLEMPNAWLDKVEYDDIHAYSYNEPKGVSLFYVSLNYFWLAFLKFFGIDNQAVLVFLTRILHAFISMFVISFGYRITNILSDKKTALITAALLSFLWVMPYLSVHSIPAFASAPFLLYATLVIVRQNINAKNNNTTNVHRSSYIIAGFFLGLAFSIRYQNILFVLGILLALMLLKNFKNSLLTLCGFIISICIVLVVPDMLVWGSPFAELQVFIQNSMEYIQNDVNTFSPWYSYSIPLLAIILVLPASLMLMWGFLCSCRNNILLFLPTALFLLYYCIFPNTNLAYISSILPLVIILGIIGWKEFKDKSVFWNKHVTLNRSMIWISSIINLLALVYISVL